MGRSVEATTARVNSNTFRNIASKSQETDSLVENQAVTELIDTVSQVSTVIQTYINTLLENKPIDCG